MCQVRCQTCKAMNEKSESCKWSDMLNGWLTAAWFLLLTVKAQGQVCSRLSTRWGAQMSAPWREADIRKLISGFPSPHLTTKEGWGGPQGQGKKTATSEGGRPHRSLQTKLPGLGANRLHLKVISHVKGLPLMIVINVNFKLSINH